MLFCNNFMYREEERAAEKAGRGGGTSGAVGRVRGTSGAVGRGDGTSGAVARGGGTSGAVARGGSTSGALRRGTIGAGHSTLGEWIKFFYLWNRVVADGLVVSPSHSFVFTPFPCVRCPSGQSLHLFQFLLEDFSMPVTFFRL